MNQKGSIQILFVLLLVAVFGGLFYFHSTKVNNEVPLKSNVVNHNSKYKIAFHSGGDKLGAGDLWIMNDDGSDKKQITHTNTIDVIHAWSPDNQLIAVTLQEPDGPNKVKWSIGTVNVNTGEVSSWYKPEGVSLNLFWLSNDILIFPDGKQIKTVSIADKKQEVLVKTDPSNKDASHIVLTVSPDRKIISYHYEGNGEGDPPQVDTNTYTLNLETQKKQVVYKSGHFKGWRDNKVVFQSPVDWSNSPDIHNIIWEIDPNEGNKKQLLKIDGELINLTVAPNGKYVVYQIRDYKNKPASAKLFLADLSRAQVNEIRKSENPDGIGNLKFSDDSEDISYAISPNIEKSQIFVQNIATLKEQLVCDNGLPGNCSYVTWSH